MSDIPSHFTKSTQILSSENMSTAFRPAPATTSADSSSSEEARYDDSSSDSLPVIHRNAQISMITEEDFWAYIDTKLNWVDTYDDNPRLMANRKNKLHSDLSSEGIRYFSATLATKTLEIHQNLTSRNYFNNYEFENISEEIKFCSHIIARGSVFTTIIYDDPEFATSLICDNQKFYSDPNVLFD